MIVTVERAICERLRRGLGNLVTCVESYGGEFEGEISSVVRRFPAVWVTFLGYPSSKPTGVDKRTHLVTATFSVLVGSYSLVEQNARRGLENDAGSYQLVSAVRRLLSRQDLGLPIDYLTPSVVRVMFNSEMQNQAISVFACEFTTAWREDSLENGYFPCPENFAQDVIFKGAKGQVSPAASELKAVDIRSDNYE